jgi:hypothetical protein
MVFGAVGETLELFIVMGMMALGLFIIYWIQKQTMR